MRVHCYLGKPRDILSVSRQCLCFVFRCSIIFALLFLSRRRMSQMFRMALRSLSASQQVVIGYEESSQLDVEPAKYFVLVTKREKRACRSCEELGVASAPLPQRWC